MCTDLTSGEGNEEKLDQCGATDLASHLHTLTGIQDIKKPPDECCVLSVACRRTFMGRSILLIHTGKHGLRAPAAQCMVCILLASS